MKITRCINKNITTKLKETRCSVIIGLLIMSNLIVTCIAELISIEGLFPIFVVGMGILDVLVAFDTNKLKTKGTKNVVIVFLIVSFVQIICALVFFKYPETKYFAECLVCIAMPSLYVGMNRINSDDVRRTIIIIGLILLPILFLFTTKEYNVYNSDMQMGLSYALLPMILICIWQLYVHDKTMYTILACIILALCIWIESMLMTRGAIFIVFIYVGWMSVKYFKFNKNNVVFVVAIIVLGTLLYFLMFRKIFVSSDWFRLMFIAKKNDFLNGRQEDYKNVLEWRGVLRMIIGNGIGSYQFHYGLPYIHNLLLHIYFEQGLFMMGVMIIIILCSFNRINKKGNELLLVIFCVSIIRLMVSYYYWIDVNFWILLGMLSRQVEEEEGFNIKDKRIVR